MWELRENTHKPLQVGTARLDFLNDFLNDFSGLDYQQKIDNKFGKGALLIQMTSTSITHFFWGINLMERYGDLDELFPFCTVDGSEILNRLRC